MPERKIIPPEEFNQKRQEHEKWRVHQAWIAMNQKLNQTKLPQRENGFFKGPLFIFLVILVIVAGIFLGIFLAPRLHP